MLGCAVLKGWSFSEKVGKVGAFVIRLHPETRRFCFVLERDASPCLRLFSGRLQLIAAAHVCITPSFPTEGKQMRSNVNSRLLMQHCAKMRAPAAQIECAAPPSIRHGGELLEFLFRPEDKKGKKKNPMVHTHSCVHTCDATLAKHRGLPPTLYQLWCGLTRSRPGDR